MYVDFTLELLQSLQKEYGVAPTTMLNETFAVLPKLGVVVMPSTGLKDRNEKAIFEGDVIEMEWSKTDRGRYPVTWVDGGFEYYPAVRFNPDGAKKTLLPSSGISTSILTCFLADCVDSRLAGSDS
jgi:hypothetical protein